MESHPATERRQPNDGYPVSAWHMQPEKAVENVRLIIISHYLNYTAATPLGDWT